MLPNYKYNQYENPTEIKNNPLQDYFLVTGITRSEDLGRTNYTTE